MEDEAIVELYLHRDEAALRHTAEKYGSRLRSLSYGILNDPETAEECENDTYLSAWNSIPPHEPRSYFYAFLARITRNLSLSRCRERNRLKRRGDTDGWRMHFSVLFGDILVEIRTKGVSPEWAFDQLTGLLNQ